MAKARATGSAETSRTTSAARVEDVRLALREELDQVLPHVVAALKRNDAFDDIARRLDIAERRLRSRDAWPIASRVARLLHDLRRLDFDAEAKDVITRELQEILRGAGFEEFGEVGEPFDPDRHEALESGSDDKAPLVVEKVFERGLEVGGQVLVKSRVRVAGEEALV